MTDYAARREMMVDTQVRPSDVTKFPIIEAMLTVPREKFVPRSMREAAYMDGNIDLGRGRCILEPRTFGKMLDALELGASDMVLDIGIGFGYSAAVLARMTQVVVGVESDADMAQEAQSILSESDADNVIVHEGPLEGGAPEHGPYDAIILQGGAQDIPEGLINQLKDGGRMAVLFMDGELGEVRIGHKIDGTMNWRRSFNAAAPVMSGYGKQSSFAL